MFSRMSFSSYVYTNPGNTNKSQHTPNEGSVTLEKNEKREKKIKKDEGEYVDYEEVK
jgi:hypothetical protein